MKIRKLSAKDARFFASILSKNLDVLTAFSKADTSDDAALEAVGREMVARLLGDNLDLIWSWLADMAEMTPAEFDEADVDAPIATIEAVAGSEELGRFFGSVRRLLAGGLLKA